MLKPTYGGKALLHYCIILDADSKDFDLSMLT